jgi:hypothetical protein
MIVICAWCDRNIGEKEGRGITPGICDECLKKLESRELQVGRGLTSGRCHCCMIRFVWGSPVRLKKALCPFCHTALRRTTHLFKRGISMAIDRPDIRKRLFGSSGE